MKKSFSSLNIGKNVQSGGYKPWMYILPTIILLGFWLYKPLIQTLIYTFFEWNMLPGTVPQYVGLKNFSFLFTSPEFKQALINTFYYILALIPFSVIFPLIVSAIIKEVNPKAQKIYRVLIFIPMIMPPVANSIIFRWLFHPTSGLFNHILTSLGIFETGLNFFTDSMWARRTVALITGWKMFSYASIMYSGAIGAINEEYYEAARLDGAGSVRRFIDITIPMLSPTIMLMLMMSVLFAAQWTFNYIDLLTQGGPYGTSTNFYYMIYKNAFLNSNVGSSAAASFVFILVFGTISLLLQRISKKLMFYDN